MLLLSFFLGIQYISLFFFLLQSPRRLLQKSTFYTSSINIFLKSQLDRIVLWYIFFLESGSCFLHVIHVTIFFSQLLSHSSFPFLLISLTPSFSPLLFHSFLRRLQPLNHFLSQLPLALNSLSFSQPLSFPVSLQYLSLSSLPLFLRLSLLFLLSIYLSFPISFFFFHLLFPLATPCSHLMHFLINREIQTSTHACNFSQSVFPANFGEREFIWDLYDSKLLFLPFSFFRKWISFLFFSLFLFFILLSFIKYVTSLCLIQYQCIYHVTYKSHTLVNNIYCTMSYQLYIISSHYRIRIIL